MRILRLTVAAVALVALPTAGESAGADTFDEVPVDTAVEPSATESYVARCSAAGGDVETRPWPQRSGTITECVRTYTVRRGDWLWKVARATLRERGVRPTSAAVKTEAARVYEANASTIGTNPNRLLVGQKLRVVAIDGGFGTFQGPTLR